MLVCKCMHCFWPQCIMGRTFGHHAKLAPKSLMLSLGAWLWATIMFVVRQRLLVGVVVILAAKEEVGQSSIQSDTSAWGRRSGTDDWVQQAQDFHPGDGWLCWVWSESTVSHLTLNDLKWCNIQNISNLTILSQNKIFFYFSRPKPNLNVTVQWRSCSPVATTLQWSVCFILVVLGSRLIQSYKLYFSRQFGPDWRSYSVKFFESLRGRYAGALSSLLLFRDLKEQRQMSGPSLRIKEQSLFLELQFYSGVF